MVKPLAAFFKRPVVWSILAVLWFLYDQFGRTTLNLWQENWLIEHGAAKGPPAGMIEAFAATVVIPWLTYLAGPFGMGFLIGGAVFAIPDILRAIRRWMPSSMGGGQRGGELIF